MKSSTKFWLGILTFTPIVLFAIFIIGFFTIFFENIVELQHNHNEFPLEFLQSLLWFVLLVILTVIVSLGIKIYYIVHTNNNPENDTNKKVMWTLLLIFTGIIGAIIYYFTEILPLKTLNNSK